eukprot:TRINITY_DN1176_c0_g2_i3.p3 TRINITY_DN1176_c0_g2~~TRINITY_DN1176_c0_g2_i3.p3  ORF type:complete len:126 (+),score=20.32 TRINITY_DN1176_c0_g2_i3:429-806(+)
MGDGTFGRVLKVTRKPDQQFFACKVIRAVKRYVDSAVAEAQIVEKIHRLDTEGVSRCVKVVEHFAFAENCEKHYAIVFEPLGRSLYDVIKINDYRGMGLNHNFRIPSGDGARLCTPNLPIPRLPS